MRLGMRLEMRLEMRRVSIKPESLDHFLNQKLQTLICEIIPMSKRRTHNEEADRP